MRKVGVGIIGFGKWAQKHALFYKELHDAELLAISALSESSCKKASEEYGVDTYRDYRDLLKRRDIEAVSVVVPNYLHARITIDALRAGKHVLVEKPMALSVSECEKMIETAKKMGCKLAVGHELRFSPFMKKIKDLIDEIGEVKTCFISAWRAPWRGGSRDWRYKKEQSGGLVFEEPVHYFDLLHWYLGNPKKVYAVANNTNDSFDFETNIFISINFPKNSIGALSFSMDSFDYNLTIEVVGSYGAIRGCIEGGHFLWSPEARKAQLFLKPKKDELREIKFEEKIGELWDLKREIQLWIECIKDDKEYPITGEDGKMSIAICEAVEKSIRTYRPVEFV